MQPFDGSSLGSWLPSHEARAVRTLIESLADADRGYFDSVRVQVGQRRINVSRLGPTYRSLVQTLQAAVIAQLPASAAEWRLPAVNQADALAELVVTAVTDVRDDQLTDLAEESVPESSYTAKAVLTAVTRRVRFGNDVEALYTVTEAAANELLDAIELYLLSSVLL